MNSEIVRDNTLPKQPDGKLVCTETLINVNYLDLLVLFQSHSFCTKKETTSSYFQQIRIILYNYTMGEITKHFVFLWIEAS